jgi:CubicO group peptidase (beta-lactamase class C family)
MQKVVSKPVSQLIYSPRPDTFYYAKAFGVRSLKNSDPVESLQLDATFLYASSTKLVTSIAALQCVEGGDLTLDEDITRLMPKFKDMKILTGFDEESGKLIFVKSVKTITLRYVCTQKCMY